MIYIGNKYMFHAVDTSQYSQYHYEAAIQAEYLKAASFENTDWVKILEWYNQLSKLTPSPNIDLNIGIVHLCKGDYEMAEKMFLSLDQNAFGNRKYLLHTALARLYEETGNLEKALNYLLESLQCSLTKAERALIEKRIENLR